MQILFLIYLKIILKVKKKWEVFWGDLLKLLGDFIRKGAKSRDSTNGIRLQKSIMVDSSNSFHHLSHFGIAAII